MAYASKKGYLGSNKLKRAGIKQRLNDFKREELAKCAEDPIYFCETYLKIRSVDKGRHAFEMYPFQKDMMTAIYNERFTLFNCSRQIGKSTIILAYCVWSVIFNDDYEIAVLANKAKTSYGLIRKFKALYEELPMWMQQGVVESNKGSMEFENRSLIYGTATSTDSIRGDSCNLVVIDEAAFIKDELWDEFYKSTMPTISSGQTSKMVLVSTPNGMNHWYDLVTKAKEGKGFSIYEVYWHQVPWKDEAWKQKEIERTDIGQFMQEHELEFLGTSNSLISADHIKKMDIRQPERIIWEDQFKIYVEPVEDKIYAIIADVAHGMGLDYSVVSVIDITSERLEQAAVYRCNTVSHTSFPDIIYQIGMMYNTGCIMIENNDIGIYVAEKLNDDLDYPHMYNPDLISEQGGSYKPGVRTTITRKRVGCNNLKSLIESDKFEIYDFQTVREFSNFNRNKKGTSYQASSGHDDIIMTLVLLAWAVKQQNFIELTGIDLIDQIDKGNLESLGPTDDFYSSPIMMTSVETFDVEGLGL